PPCQPGAFYSNPPPLQALFFVNPLIYKAFSETTAAELGRIIGRLEKPSSLSFQFQGDSREALLSSLADVGGTQLEDEAAVHNCTIYTYASGADQIPGSRCVAREPRLVEDRGNWHGFGGLQLDVGNIGRQLTITQTVSRRAVS